MQPFAHQDIQGWLRPGLYVAASSIQGQGLFTERPIDAGELVVRWGGRILPASTRDAGGVRDHTSVAIAEGVVIAALPDQECSPDDFMNHSCDSNLWMHDALTLCARRRIEAGEELTADYALWMDAETYVMRRECNCGAPACRRIVTGRDWRLTALRERYSGHFSPFLQRRIAGERAAS
ncbi:SET domain-containing protein [Myxococcus sp. RHSTA-1-4]|uniref:SET domain-containing protein n=1 Tax=Myxococcus sp. RHSTA-1-4 TaxID=2874601 RepID=UPI001CBF7650|nr:SET domain-containing protein-lysine N-methyltransferase [Myxococcus sp. RHSTA-1-4]MBZ4418123.1 SET domain-containing protein-lysine N-methyltransferase [Myxococcus sp. RHSTA-1-4]